MPNSERLERALQNLNHAIQSLDKAIAEPVREERDLGGIVKAFEIVYELSWKLLQKIGQDQAMEVNSPRQALEAGFSLGLITNDATWIKIKEDRNLTVHTYNRKFAEQMVVRIAQLYLAAFKDFQSKCKQFLIADP